MSQPTIHPQQAGPFQKMMPDKKNRDAWWAFLEGAPESAWNSSRPMKHGNERGEQLRGGPFKPYSGLILLSNDPLATHQPTQKSRELSPTQLFQLDHVRLPCPPKT